MATTQEERDSAAAAFLEEDPEECTPSAWDDRVYGLAEDWLILTDEEAELETIERIRQDVWAFTPSFLLPYLPEGMTEEALKAMQEKLYEGATEPILAMLGDSFPGFARDAIATDGRGHFLSSWDGVEHEFEHNGTTWYAYRS